MLGCRSDSRTLARRARAARDAFFDRDAALLVACGGRAWAGRVEADAISEIVCGAGVPADSVVRERRSRDTRENARFAASLLRRRGIDRVALVTCAWHLPRATKLFRAAGIDVDGIGVPPVEAGRLTRVYWTVREIVSTWKDTRRGAIVR